MVNKMVRYAVKELKFSPKLGGMPGSAGDQATPALPVIA
jgi:hypothetical protein